MDLKNIIAAIALSAAVIVLYGLFFAPTQEQLDELAQASSRSEAIDMVNNWGWGFANETWQLENPDTTVNTEINAASTAAALKALLTGPSTVTQNKKYSDGNDIEHTDAFGKSYDPKQYEQETVGNTSTLEGKYPWPDAPTS